MTNDAKDRRAALLARMKKKNLGEEQPPQKSQESVQDLRGALQALDDLVQERTILPANIPQADSLMAQIMTGLKGTDSEVVLMDKDVHNIIVYVREKKLLAGEKIEKKKTRAKKRSESAAEKAQVAAKVQDIFAGFKI